MQWLLDPGFPVQAFECLKTLAITDPKLFCAAAIEDRLHRLPNFHRLPPVPEGGVKDQPVNISGLQVAQGGFKRLFDLHGKFGFGIIRHPLRILPVGGGEFCLQVDVGPGKPGGQA